MTTSPKLLLPVLPEPAGLAISKMHPVASCLYHLPGSSKLKTLLRKKYRRGTQWISDNLPIHRTLYEPSITAETQSPDLHHGELSSRELPRLQTFSLENFPSFPRVPFNSRSLFPEDCMKLSNSRGHEGDLYEPPTITEVQSPGSHHGELSSCELPRLQTSSLVNCPSLGAQQKCQNPLIQKIPPETSSSPLFLPEKCRKLPYSDNAEKSLCKASIISAVQPPAFHPSWRTVQQPRL